MDNNINIRKFIVHILDNSIEVPVLSDEEHSLNYEINEFLSKHLEKALHADNLKSAHFINDSNSIKNGCVAIADHDHSFVVVTKNLAADLYEIMKRNGDIPPGDVVFIEFSNNNIPYLGILKFNYKSSYIHYVETSSIGNKTSIIKQKTALPSENQKVDEAIFINLNDFSIKLLEKRYEIDGEKQFYLSTLFLNCTSEISPYQKAKIFTKVTEDFSNRYFEKDAEKIAEVRKTIVDNVDENNCVNIKSMAQNLFRDNLDMQTSFVETVKKSGLKDDVINIHDKIIEKKFRKQKIKTDIGIEINLPIEYYNDPDKVEFITNIDGTISLVMKNIGKITNLN